MVTHKIKRRDGSIEEYIYYTLQEARKKGIRYKRPRFNKTLRVGDHILTDDGWVCPVLFVNYSARNPYFRTPTGTFLIFNSYLPIDAKKRKNRFSFSGKRYGEGGKLSRYQRRFVWEFCQCGDKYEAFKRAYGKEGTSSQISALMRAPKIKEAIMRQIQILLQAANVREQEIVLDLIETYKELKGVLKTLKNDPTPENTKAMTEVALTIEKIISRLGDWLGYGKEEERSWGYFQSFSHLPKSREVQMLEEGKSSGQNKKMDSEGNQTAGGITQENGGKRWDSSVEIESEKENIAEEG